MRASLPPASVYNYYPRNDRKKALLPVIAASFGVGDRTMTTTTRAETENPRTSKVLAIIELRSAHRTAAYLFRLASTPPVSLNSKQGAAPRLWSSVDLQNDFPAIRRLVLRRACPMRPPVTGESRAFAVERLTQAPISRSCCARDLGSNWVMSSSPTRENLSASILLSRKGP